MGNALHNFECADGVVCVWLMGAGSRHFVVVVVLIGDLTERLCKTRFVIGNIVCCGRGVATNPDFSAITILAIVRERKTGLQAVWFVLKHNFFAIVRFVSAGSWVLLWQLIEISWWTGPGAVLGTCSRTFVLLKSRSKAVMRGTRGKRAGERVVSEMLWGFVRDSIQISLFKTKGKIWAFLNLLHRVTAWSKTIHSSVLRYFLFNSDVLFLFLELKSQLHRNLQQLVKCSNRALGCLSLSI